MRPGLFTVIMEMGNLDLCASMTEKQAGTLSDLSWWLYGQGQYTGRREIPPAGNSKKTSGCVLKKQVQENLHLSKLRFFVQPFGGGSPILSIGRAFSAEMLYILRGLQVGRMCTGLEHHLL